jgi:hypothetical protein
MYFFQLDMRRKQFHVLIAAIHELQQILKGKYTHSLTVGLFQDDNTFDIHYSSFVFCFFEFDFDEYSYYCSRDTRHQSITIITGFR